MTDKDLIATVRTKAQTYDLSQRFSVLLLCRRYEKAIQEREERSKGCVYCLDDCCAPLDWEYGLDHILPDYKFCPMCGKRLREE